MCVCVFRATSFQHFLGRLCCEIIKCIQTFDSVVVVVVVVVRRMPGEGYIIWIILAGQHLRRGTDVSHSIGTGCVGVRWTELQGS